MPTPPITSRYYPRLSSVVSENDIPDILGFIKTGVVNLLDRIYFKDLQYSKSPKGDAAFYGLSIVSPKRLDIEIPGTGIYLILNYDADDSGLSSFPITVEYEWKILAYLRFFSLGNFSFSPEQIFEVALRVLNISEEQAISHFINTFVEPADQNTTPLQQFITDLNVQNPNWSSPIPNPSTVTTITEVVEDISSRAQNYSSLVAFAKYLLTNNTQDTANKVKAYFRVLVPQDVDEFIREVITPKFRATLLLSAAIEFPRNILRPVYPYGTYDNSTIPPTNISLNEIPETALNNKLILSFAEALFYADTERGFGYNLDLVLNLNQPAMIGNTGLIIDIRNLKIDISKTENIAEADADGRPKEFMGVYMEYTEVFLPKKWFKKESGQTIGISANHLLVGTGGISGNISIRATYAFAMENGQPVVTSYFQDYFELDYSSLSVYSMADPLNSIPIQNHAQLVAYINSLPNPGLLKFQFPVKLNYNGAIKEFKAEGEYLAFIQSLQMNFFDFNSYLRFELGQNENRKWEIGFRKFDIDFHHGKVVYSALEAALKITKFKKVNPQSGQSETLYIDFYGEWESNENFKLSATFLPELKMNLFNILDFNLQNATLGKENNNFYIEADTKIFFTTDLGIKLMGNTPIDLPAIRIYANGRFEIAGGNTSIPVNINLPLGPVGMSVTAIHFGSIQKEHNGRMRQYNYVGFDGGISVNPIGLDVRGDGIKYYYTIDNDEMAAEYGGDDKDYRHDYFHISTIEIDLVIPGDADPSTATAIIKGSLTIPEPGVSTEYRGKVSVQIPKASIYGSAEIRYDPKYPAFAVDAMVEFPVPIPLGPIGIFGFRGLIGRRYVAEKEAVGMTQNDTWYDYYVSAPRGLHLDPKFSGPDKTKDYANAFSVGVGASIAPTGGDRIMSLRAMMLLSLPSMFAIDAGLTILSEKLGIAEVDPKEPPFYAFIIIGDSSLEFGAGANFMVNKKNGSYIHVQAEVQMGFFFKNQKPWYINFGTKEKPIKVLMLKDTIPINAQGFLMISASGIESGARIDLNFNLLILKIWAVVEIGGHVSFERPQVGGYLYVEGGAEVNLWIVKVSICVSVYFRIELVKPFLILAELQINIKVKVFIIKVSLKVKLVFKWEKNNQVDTAPVAPITYQDDNPSVYPDLAKKSRVEDAVKGIHMLTYEEFEINYLGIIGQPDLNKITSTIPLDTYIDISTEKGLIPTALVGQKIGGHTGAAHNFTDLIPPKKVVKGGHTLRQVKHQYSIEDIQIKFYDYNSLQWKDYHPYKAMEPSQAVDSLKVGFWQKNNNQYNSIRILGTTPFSFMDGSQPGWFTPEQYGITPSSLFCTNTISNWYHSNFENKPLGTSYYPPTQYPNEYINGAYYNLFGDWYGMYSQGSNGSMLQIQGVDNMVVTNAANSHNFSNSLTFSNNNTLVITLEEESALVNIALSTLAKGVTIKYYKTVPTNAIYPTYVLIEEIYKTQSELNNIVEYSSQNFPHQYISKIEIIPDNTDQTAINIINNQIEQLWANAITNTNGAVTAVVLSPQEQEEYEALLGELNYLLSLSCNNQSCQKDELLCEFLEQLTQSLNSCIQYIGVEDLFYDNWHCFTGMVHSIESFSLQYPDYHLYTQLESKIDILLLYPSVARPPFLSGALSAAQGLLNQISIIGNCNCQTNDPVICTTSLQQVSWMTVLDYQTQQTIPSQAAIEADYQQMVAGIEAHTQPIWKPNTTYCIHIKLKDNINDGQTAGAVWEYTFGFKTVGPLGHFDKRTDYIKFDDENNDNINDNKREEYPITGLKSYIDMRRSYPNAGGNLLGSKPLFYGHYQCKLNIFFVKPYVYHMFNTWQSYQGLNAIKGNIHTIIKDPVTDQIIPYPLPQDWLQNPPDSVPVPSAVSPGWIDDDDPNLPLSIQQLNSFINSVNANSNSINCNIELGEPIKPKSYSYSLIVKNLEPQKLYTAIIYNAFDENESGEIANQTNQANEIIYEETQKIHEYVFKTSRYSDFAQQVNSYQLKEYDDNGNLLEVKSAVYDIVVDLTPLQISETYTTMEGMHLDGISNVFSNPFDRIVEGIWGLRPLDPPNFTEFIKLRNQDLDVIALIIRNPEPFNDPKTPVDINLQTIEITEVATDGNPGYKKLFSKDYSQVIIMNPDKKITAQTLTFRFKYLLWNGSEYQEIETVTVNNIHINN
ncbi:hypothetical protein P0M11_11130 [Kaistella sp. PBT33-4]|uniref:hypothetical protein n=1 Tax=Kaistella sp. PBT33-4 TaxID=3032000 RepID=UPI0023D80682|nr:hypothetical protein [Kaistella sp. PBT33-4]MDF0720550.1 hypothetical protein [Kaistella sp. PBT33-4]